MIESDEQPPHFAVRGPKTVCRCNDIKYETIECAIRDGAHTLTQVATRTTATTGQCGGSCTPDVQEMLAEHAPQRPLRASGGGAGAGAWWVRRND